MSLNIPNLLSLFRIFLAPFLLLVSWMQNPTLFFTILFLMLLSDALDGIIARALNQTSDIGAKLDSYGDIVTYLSTPLAAWWLWPKVMMEEKFYIILAIFVYILPAIFSLIKFRSLASYHTWITKISAVLMSVGIVMLFGFNDSSIFHISVWFLVIEAVENIAITLLINRPKTDVRSLWHVWKGMNYS